MSSNRTGFVGNRMWVAVLATALCVASFEIDPARASAQCVMPSPTCSQVTPDGKGMIGLGLIGLELGFVIPALVQEAAGTNEWWPYLVFPVLGAAGGVVGGYFMEEETRATNSPEIDVIFLAIGMALVVPTLVATLALTAYDPADDAVSVGGDQGGEEPAFSDETTTEAVQDEGAEPAPATEGGSSSIQGRVRSLLAGGPGLLRFDGQGRQLLLGVPMISRQSTFTAAESDALNLAPATDVHVPLVSATF